MTLKTMLPLGFNDAFCFLKFRGKSQCGMAKSGELFLAHKNAKSPYKGRKNAPYCPEIVSAFF